MSNEAQALHAAQSRYDNLAMEDFYGPDEAGDEMPDNVVACAWCKRFGLRAVSGRGRDQSRCWPQQPNMPQRMGDLPFGLAVGRSNHILRALSSKMKPLATLDSLGANAILAVLACACWLLCCGCDECTDTVGRDCTRAHTWSKWALTDEYKGVTRRGEFAAHLRTCTNCGLTQIKLIE